MTSSRPAASSSPEPPTVERRLRLTRRGTLVLRAAAAVFAAAVLVLVVHQTGLFGGRDKKGSTPASAAGASPGSTASPDVSAHPTATAKPVAQPVHRVKATTESWRLPTSISRLVVFPAAGGLQLVGGLLDGDHSSSLVQQLALPSGKVTADGHLAVGVHDAAGVAYKGQLLVFGGGSTSEQAGVQRLVPGTTAKTVGSLPQPRSDLSAAIDGGKVIIVGGYDGTRALADVLVTTDGTHFRVLARLPVPVRYAAVVAKGGYVYVYGGDVDRKPSNVIQRVDVARGTATLVGHLPQPLSHEAALVFGRTIWLAGGVTPSGTTARLYRSDNALTFVAAGSLPAPRSDAGVALLHGVGYLVGGESPARLNTVVAVSP